jgi:hypothetical protein
MKNTFKTIITAGLLITGVAHANTGVMCDSWTGPDSSKLDMPMTTWGGTMFELEQWDDGEVFIIKDRHGDTIALHHVGRYNDKIGLYNGYSAKWDSYQPFMMYGKDDGNIDILEVNVLTAAIKTTCYF